MLMLLFSTAYVVVNTQRKKFRLERIHIQTINIFARMLVGIYGITKCSFNLVDKYALYSEKKLSRYILYI